MEKLKQVMRNVVRGSGTMPHVGEHPGLPMVIFGGVFLLLTIFVNGPFASITLLMLGLQFFLLLAFAVGSYERALLVDALRREEEQRVGREDSDGC